MDIASTKLLYLEDFNLLQAEATVLDALGENDRDTVILDQTIFYPQGGGQPYDTGTIESDDNKFVVEEVRSVDGVVKHIGKFETGKFGKNTKVRLSVDKDRRDLHSKLHSAGHVVDMAVFELKLNWAPGKGYHFPQGPYVEYIGNLEGLDKEELKGKIERICNRLIQEGRETKLMFMDKEKMKSICHFVPDYIPEGKPSRVVIYGDFGIPCGGTHVSNIKEIGKIMIRKIKAEKGNIRVGYDVIPKSV